jgi:AcrR family transcriptional regulator
MSMSKTRRQILDTASSLFAERGYELVGVNEIIDKAGVAKATFYSNFRSKEMLCAAWLRAEAEGALGGNRRLLKEPVSAEEKIRLKFEGIRKYVETSNFRGCPFSITASMLCEGSEVRGVIRDYKAEARAFWQSLALEIRRDPSEARALGDALFLLFSGAVSEAQNARSTWPVDSSLEAALMLCHAFPER